ncbi:VOC family protein [Swaminathania salitolerans]|uniref:Glyoxalase n=1 Tax=Swaminathania salitolerans TaxID=182838 RepID=A0A511BM96_9PROT|nr:VOC family protein [Swaminathania salitolerans]GBQ09363.1 bleomycin resistance protein [Swaminathania salitolerans LMG 21291]GEL01003.1 glyoxalase [Swaminathania salitolerans]
MFSHVMLGSNDLERSKTFYDAALGALGCPPATPDPKGRLFYSHDGGRFIITKPIDGKPATGANGGTIGFLASSPEAVKAWYEAGAAHGGTPIEAPPGPRETAMGTLHLAYLRDPDGNKLCAFYKEG